MIGKERIYPGQLANTPFQRGDLITFYDREDRAIHVAVATGDNQDVYSLWHTPHLHPANVPASSLFIPGEAQSANYITVTTPSWHK